MTSHEFLDHTSETVLRVQAQSLSGLLEEAARALGAIEREGKPGAEERIQRQVEIQSDDAAGLLVDFLNEVIWLCETDRFTPDRAHVTLKSDTSLIADLEGDRLAEAPSLVKAATRHALRLKAEENGWTAEVTLDV